MVFSLRNEAYGSEDLELQVGAVASVDKVFL